MVPGEYRIFSWDSDVDFDWYDAEQLKPYESKGVRISVEEGDRKTAQLTVIETENASRGASETVEYSGWRTDFS
jgi:hypothetical protein